MSAMQIVSVVSGTPSVDGLSLTDVRLIATYEAAVRGDAILVPYDPALLACLPRDPETIVTVLDIAQTARFLENDGILRYGWARAHSLGLLTLLRWLPTGIRLAPQLPRSWMAGLGLMLVAAELRHVADHGFRAAALDWQLSDFMVSVGDPWWLSRYIALTRGYGLRVGLCSNDVGRVLRLAGELPGLDFVIAPLSAAGFRMTPDRSTCEGAIRRRCIELFPHLGSLSTVDPEDRAYAEGLGLTRIVVDA